MTSDVQITRAIDVRINANSNDRRASITAIENAPRSSITAVTRGIQGEAGDSVAELEPRIDQLEMDVNILFEDLNLLP